MAATLNAFVRTQMKSIEMVAVGKLRALGAL
jgi:hypothetical protein